MNSRDRFDDRRRSCHLASSTFITVSCPLTLSALNLIFSPGLTVFNMAGSLALNTIVMAPMSRLVMASCLMVNLPADSSIFSLAR